jgi:tetratricopeptide (TPR) repeat protein
VVIDAERPDRLKTQEAQGKLAEFYDLEKRIACDVLQGLNRDCDGMPVAFHKIHTKSLDAFISWSNGLEALDRGRYTEAMAWFQKAVDQDPAFDLAKESLLSTPDPAMSSMTALQMVSTLSGDGDGENAPWKFAYLSLLEDGQLEDAVSLAFGTEKNQRTTDCLNLALGEGYNSYQVLKTMFEVGGDLDLDGLCEAVSASGIMKATFARAARDAVSPTQKNVYTFRQIAQSQCFRGEEGLAYTPSETEAIDLPPDPKIPKRTVSTITP